MTTAPSPDEFVLLRDWLEAASAIYLTPGKEYLLHARLQPLLAEYNVPDYTTFYERHLQFAGPALRAKVVDAMTTNETYWFRDDAPWLLLRDRLLPELVERRRAENNRPLRIWCAASSTGQEPYTIAMLVDTFCTGSTALQPRDVQILASDISPTAIQQARAGRYGQVEMTRGFEGSWAGYRSRYFDHVADGAQVKAEIRRRVEFFEFNLKDTPKGMGTFDLIYMRNVAIYFSNDFKRGLYERLAKVLHPKGALVIGATESLYGVSKAFKAQPVGSQTLYRLP